MPKNLLCRPSQHEGPRHRNGRRLVVLRQPPADFSAHRPDKDPGVEVSTIKLSSPDETGELFAIRGRHVVTIGTPALDLIKFASGLNPHQIVGAPEWLAKDRFDVDAVPSVEGIPNNAQMWMMVRRILADRFQLKYEFVQKDMPAFALVKAGRDTHLKISSRSSDDPVDMYGSNGELTVNNATMNDFALGLSRGFASRPVVNQTGIEGRYDFKLKWSFESSATSDPDVSPGFFTALQDQLGLSLKPTHAEIKVLRIDHIDHPSAN